MIIEGIVTSINVDGDTHVAALGAITEGDMKGIMLRPFQTSRTFENLKRDPEGVFHIVDDVELLCRAAIGRWESRPRLAVIDGCRVPILKDACRWHAFRVKSLDDSQPRAELQCEIHRRGELREVSGFNRAKYAVLELAILATRLHLLSPADVCNEVQRAYGVVKKTAGPAEERALQLLIRYIDDYNNHDAS